MLDDLKLNSCIDLITKEDEKVSGIIHDIVDDTVLVSLSADDKEFKLIRPGEDLECIASDAGAIFSFDAVMSGRILSKSNFPVYELSSLKNFRKIQRRQDVRVPCSMPVHFIDEDKIQDKKKPSEEFLKGTSVNLSAGGMKLFCYEDYPEGTVLLLDFSLEEKRYRLRGRILHKEFVTLDHRTVYHYGIQFVGISEKQREKIIRHLFVLMRKNRLR